MIANIILGAIILFAAARPALAQHALQNVPTQEQAEQDSTGFNGNFLSRPGETRFVSAIGIPDDRLLIALSTWLSDNFPLPRSAILPAVKLTSPSAIAALRRSDAPSLEASPVGHPGQREVVAVYSNVSRTIYLSDTWRGATAAEMSVLVHEMTHHLQNMGQVRPGCPEENEQLAYAAQQRWLELSGRDLMTDFDIDPFTLLATTTCPY